MSVSVTCICGKRIKAASRFAGKRVKCPVCGLGVEVPAAMAAGTGAAQSPGSVCPHCRAGMRLEDALCVQCGYHRDRGERLRTVVTEPVMHGRPHDYRVDEQEDRLTFTRGPAIKGGLPWEMAVLAILLAAIGAVWLYHPLAATILLTISIPLYVIALHRETISVDRRQLTVRHYPFPWPRRTIPVGEVEQLYCRKQYRSRGSNRDGFYTYEVHVLTKSGRRPKIISNLPVESHAFFFEERIEHFLGITDREVEESAWESYGWIVRSIVIVVLAIAVLIVTTFLR